MCVCICLCLYVCREEYPWKRERKGNKWEQNGILKEGIMNNNLKMYIRKELGKKRKKRGHTRKPEERKEIGY